MKGLKFLIFSLTLLLLLVVSVSLLCFSLIFLLGDRTKMIIEGDVAHEYQYLHVDETNNDSYVAVVSILEEIPSGQFLNFKYDDGSQTLISPFGTREYECTGSCYCDANVRKSSSSIARKGGMYLVAAVSSIVAYNIAQEYFDELCVVEIGDDTSCPKEAIRSEVDECKEALGERRTKGFKTGCSDCIQGLVINEDGSKSDPDDVKEKRFFCKGRCKNYDDIKEDPVKDEMCKKLEFEKQIKLKTTPDFTAESEERLARRCFAHRYLGKFCRENLPFCSGKPTGCRELVV